MKDDQFGDDFKNEEVEEGLEEEVVDPLKIPLDPEDDHESLDTLADEEEDEDELDYDDDEADSI